MTIGADPPKRLDKALARDVPEDAHLSRSRLARLIAAGDVRVNGDVAQDQTARVAEGDKITISVAAAVEVDIGPEAMDLSVVFEDDHLIVLNKPAGLVVHPAPGSPSGTLVNGLLHHLSGNLSGVGGELRPGIVHRIDKDTSGLLVVAKSDAAHHGLAAQFEAHTVGRSYLALCYGVPETGDPRLRGIRGVNVEPGNLVKITTHLARHKTDRQRQAVLFRGGRHAVTRIKRLESFGEQIALVECRLETGRTHQIRVHMAHIGHGLIGDPVYGGRRKLREADLGTVVKDIANFPRQALHAATLSFEHPVTGDQHAFDADLPADFATLLAALRDQGV